MNFENPLRPIIDADAEKKEIEVEESELDEIIDADTEQEEKNTFKAGGAFSPENNQGDIAA